VVLPRRGFLFVLGSAAATTAVGVWLPSAGLIELPRRCVLAMSGWCWFCGVSAAERFRLFAVDGGAARICDCCVDSCLDLIDDGSAQQRQPAVSSRRSTRSTTLPEEHEAIARLRETLRASRWSHEEFLAQVRAALDSPPSPAAPTPPLLLACSFCEAERSARRKLICGPSIYICNECVSDAAALMSRDVRA
jgi:hypothetical protein